MAAPLPLTAPEEADNDAAEELTPEQLAQLLLPQGLLPLEERFGLAYSSSAFNGWVKQSSPACAAASVAGAWNAIYGARRKDGGAASQVSVIEVLKELVSDQIKTKRERLERLVEAEAGALEDAVRERIHADGRLMGGKPAKGGTTKGQALKLARAVVVERGAVPGEAYAVAAAAADPTDDPAAISLAAQFSSLDVYSKLYLLYKAAGLLPDGEEEEDGGAAGGAGTELEDEDEDEGDGEGGGGGGVLVVEAGSKKPPTPDWLKELKELLGKLGTMEQLSKPKPSTSGIGNWGITGALKRLAAAAAVEGGGAEEGRVGRAPGGSVRAWCLMGRKVKGRSPEVVVSARDGEAEWARQWASLRDVLLRPGHAVVIHLKNHYALLFALREWVDDAGEPVREVLTAVKGQRPTTWMAWSDLLTLMVKWTGYCIMGVQAA